MKLIFLIISYFGAKLLALDLRDFFIFLGYLVCELIKLTRVNLHFLTQYFFYLTSIFLTRFFFWKSFFFISISCCNWQVSRVNPSWIDFFSSFFYDFIFFQFYHFVLNYFPLNFIIFLLIFLFRYLESELVKLTWVNMHFH